jgi:hypothetical protein
MQIETTGIYYLLVQIMTNSHIVIVITQYISDAGFQSLRPFVFVPSLKNIEKCLEVSEIMLIFAPLKLQCGTSMPPHRWHLLYLPYLSN